MTTITVDTSALYADEEKLGEAIRRALRYLVARVREADEESGDADVVVELDA